MGPNSGLILCPDTATSRQAGVMAGLTKWGNYESNSSRQQLNFREKEAKGWQEEK